MDKLKTKRTVSRSSFTKTLNLMKEILDEDDSQIDLGKLKDGLIKLEKLSQDIKLLDEGILDSLIDSKALGSDLNSEAESAEKYSDELITIKRRIKERIDKCSRKEISKEISNNESENSSPMTKIKQYKLPKIDIRPFDGLLINYLSFWSQFKKIHEDSELDDSDKFQYLIQSVQSGTRARELLESYPLTSENYSKAVAAFNERFGNKDILVEVYVREFLKLIIANARANWKDRLPLPDLYMKVDAHLRSLESMGLESEQNSAWLYPMVESSLPEEVLKAWQRSSLSRPDTEETNSSNLSRLMKFLKWEVEGEERLRLARTGFEVEDNIPNNNNFKYKENKSPLKMPTAASLFSGSELICIFCNKSHVSKDCFAARGFTMQERFDKVRKSNCCLKSLRFGHQAKVCKVFVRCHVCSKPHTELFCPELSKSKETENYTENTTEVFQNTTTASKSCSRKIALMTLEVVIKGPKSKKVRALLDSGSQRSYILKKTAEELRLPPLSSETIVHKLFGGNETEAQLHKKFRIELNAPGSQNRENLVVEFLDQEKICGNIPRLPKENLLKELKENRLWVSDIGYGSPEIEILIGSDIYGQLLTGRVKQLKSGLTAIQTKLGWTLCGEIESPCQTRFTGQTSKLITNLALTEWSVPDSRRLETIRIDDSAQKMSNREEELETVVNLGLEGKSGQDSSHPMIPMVGVSDSQDSEFSRNPPEVLELSSSFLSKRTKHHASSVSKISDSSKTSRNSEEFLLNSLIAALDAADTVANFTSYSPVCSTASDGVMSGDSSNNNFSNTEQWFYVPGNLNPADLPSRGCSPRHLVDSGWWEGPSWLKEEKSDWPKKKGVLNEEFVPLTPLMFLQDISEIGVPDLDMIDNKKLQLRHRYCQKLRKELRSRFRREYLSQLVQRAGSVSETLKEGNVVFVGIDHQKRLQWPMAIVKKIFPSRDGRARVVELKTQSGTLIIRPIQKLFLLEVNNREDPVIQVKRSRYGRTVKVPQKYSK